MFFFSSQIYLRFLKETKNFSIDRTSTEMKQNLLHWFFFRQDFR